MRRELTAEMVKTLARDQGAILCGIGDIRGFEGVSPQHHPASILPNARCVIGCAFPVPKGLYRTMESKAQYYTYASLGVKYMDETFAEIFLLNMARLIEDAGYDACIQRKVSGMRVQGDKTTNPEVKNTYELVHASPVAPDQPVPDVILDTDRAAVVCGLGTPGLHGQIITKRGTFLRFVYIITDAPLACDEACAESLCDGCGECAKACPGHAIDGTGLDTWQCAVYYRGAHKSNPFMTEDFLAGDPEREAIVNGDKRFDAESARALYPALRFLPETHFGYVPCLCGKKCELACARHRKEGKA